MAHARLAALVVLALGCAKAPAPVQTEAAAPARAGPDLLTAVRVDVRETSDADGKRGDVVVALTRTGDHFDWDGKGVPYPDALGERVADPRSHRKCACEVSAVCPRCDGLAADELVRKSGTLAAANVEAFLAEVMRHEKGDAGDAGATYSAHVDAVHVAITLPGIDEPVHVSYFDSHHTWMRDDQPLQGDAAALDAAWNALAGTLGLDGWLASMSPPVMTSLPADFASLPSAEELEIHDQWNGLGRTHDVVVRLERTRAGFAWRAKVASWSGSLGESTPDPYDPKQKDQKTCTCGVDDVCPCENARDTLHEKGTVAAAKIEAFLRSIATHTIDSAPPNIGGRWTDDYPKGHVVVWVTKTGTPVHLSFLDQQRQWRADGRVLSPDPSPAVRREPESQHAVINASYEDMLHALGLASWIDAVHAQKPKRRRTR